MLKPFIVIKKTNIIIFIKILKTFQCFFKISHTITRKNFIQWLQSHKVLNLLISNRTSLNFLWKYHIIIILTFFTIRVLIISNANRKTFINVSKWVNLNRFIVIFAHCKFIQKVTNTLLEFPQLCS